MDEAELKAIEARADAATKGPWWGYDVDTPYVDIAGADCYIETGNPEDAYFIGHSRADIPAPCAEVRRLRQLINAASIQCGGEACAFSCTTQCELNCEMEEQLAAASTPTVVHICDEMVEQNIGLLSTDVKDNK